MTDAEADQDPAKLQTTGEALHLYITFAEARLAPSTDSAASLKWRSGQQIHDLLKISRR